MSDKRIRRVVHFCGRVQGVGFRYTTQTIARSRRVTGYVRNLADGRVEMVVEGGAQEVDAFQQAVEKALKPNITEVQASETPATGEFTSFRIAC